MMFQPRMVVTMLLACCSFTMAQQFVEQPKALPGPVVWSEAVIPFDANGDGRMDLLFINANGWRKPGDLGASSSDPLSPTLLLNEGVESEKLRFRDATGEYFPQSFLVHGKSAAVCDFNGDGLDDVAVAVAFGAQPRLLLRDATSGRFVDETSRLPKMKINSNSVGWGDLDGDGDLDLVFTDSGPNSDKAPGGRARLLLNDGKGNFADASERLGAIEKIGAQNAKIVDIDGDLDLDVVVDGKSTVTQCYINNGAGVFKLDTKTFPEADKGGQPYEIEWGDLDNDGDLDAVHMNFFGERRRKYSNISVRNLLKETGTLAFQVERDGLEGKNEQDENDFALLDVDDDGDLDLLVGVLVSSRCEEKLFINDGTAGKGCFKQREGAFTFFMDGTLDMTVGDFDGDHRVDVVTAQGENHRHEDFRNRYYRNTGPPDTKAPWIGRVSKLVGKTAQEDLDRGVQVVRAWVQDGTIDDGVTFVKATLAWESSQAGKTRKGEIPMRHVGGGIHQAKLAVKGLEPGKAGTVSWRVVAVDPAGNRSESPVNVLEMKD